MEAIPSEATSCRGSYCAPFLFLDMVNRSFIVSPLIVPCLSRARRWFYLIPQKVPNNVLSFLIPRSDISNPARKIHKKNPIECVTLTVDRPVVLFPGHIEVFAVSRRWPIYGLRPALSHIDEKSFYITRFMYGSNSAAVNLKGHHCQSTLCDENPTRVLISDTIFYHIMSLFYTC